MILHSKCKSLTAPVGHLGAEVLHEEPDIRVDVRHGSQYPVQAARLLRRAGHRVGRVPAQQPAHPAGAFGVDLMVCHAEQLCPDICL